MSDSLYNILEVIRLKLLKTIRALIHSVQRIHKIILLVKDLFQNKAKHPTKSMFVLRQRYVFYHQSYL